MPEPLSTDPSAPATEGVGPAGTADNDAPSAIPDPVPHLDHDAETLVRGMQAIISAAATGADPVALLDLDVDALKDWLMAEPDRRIAVGDTSIHYEQLAKALDRRKWPQAARILVELGATSGVGDIADLAPVSGAPEPHRVYAAQCLVLADRVRRARHRVGRAERSRDSAAERRDHAATVVADLGARLAAAQTESADADATFRKEEGALQAAYEERRVTTQALTTYIDRAAPILEVADADPAAAVERLNAVLPPAPAPGGDSPAGTGKPLTPALARDLQLLTIGEVVDLRTAADRVDGGRDRRTSGQVRRAFGRLEKLGYIDRPAHGKYRRVR